MRMRERAVLAVLVLAVVAAVVVVLVRREGSGEQPQSSLPMAGRVAWTHDEAGEDRQTWLSGPSVVYAGRKTGVVTALDKRTGGQRWSYQVPVAAGKALCAISRERLRGSVAISYVPRDGTDCTAMLLLDLTTGTPRWQVTLKEPVRDTVEIAAGLVVAIAPGVDDDTDRARIVAFDPASGASRWQLAGTADCQRPTALSPGNQLRVMVECERSSVHLENEVWTLDPASGRLRARLVIPGPRGVIPDATFLPADRAVLHSRTTRVVTVLSPDARRIERMFTVDPARNEVSVHDRTVIVAGQQVVTVWDLTTGLPIWKRGPRSMDAPEAFQNGFQLLAGVDDAGIYCAVLGGTELQVVRYDHDSGRLTVLSPPVGTSLTADNASWLQWDGGRLYALISDGALAVE